MNVREIRGRIEDRLSSLIKGFRLEVHEQGFSFTADNGEVVNQFGGNFRSGVDVVYCDYLNGGVRFAAVEELITPILVEAQILGPSATASMRWTVSLSKNHLLGRSRFSDDRNLNIQVRKASDIDALEARVKAFYFSEARIFFDFWRDISDFEAVLDGLPPRAVAQALGTGGIFKKAVIYHLIKHKDYNMYMNTTLQNLLSARESNPEEIEYQRFYRAAELTKDKLASGELQG